MGKYDKIKSEALGMGIGKAQHRLRKQIMFSMMQRLGDDKCYRCGENICDVDSLSIEHKQAWLSSDNPKKLFWDLGNVAFSHLFCNTSHANKGKTLSEEHKMKLRKVHTGKIVSEKTKEKLRIVNSGKVLSLETRGKISKAMIGRSLSVSHKTNLSKAAAGRPVSRETREKHRLNNIKRNEKKWGDNSTVRMSDS